MRFGYNRQFSILVVFVITSAHMGIDFSVQYFMQNYASKQIDSRKTNEGDIKKEIAPATKRQSGIE